jgi:EpsI family protein
MLYFAVLATLGATVFASHLAERRPEDPLSASLDTIPHEIAGWIAQADTRVADRVTSRLRPTSYLARTYRRNGQQIDVFIAYYAQQRAGENMHSPKHCLPGNGWEIWKHGSANVSLGGKQARVNEFSIQNAGRRMLMIYWYQSRRRIVASEYTAKLLLIRDALMDGRTGGSIVRITAPDASGASERALEFAAALMPEVQRCIGS